VRFGLQSNDLGTVNTRAVERGERVAQIINIVSFLEVGLLLGFVVDWRVRFGVVLLFPLFLVHIINFDKLIKV